MTNSQKVFSPEQQRLLGSIVSDHVALRAQKVKYAILATIFCFFGTLFTVMIFERSISEKNYFFIFFVLFMVVLPVSLLIAFIALGGQSRITIGTKGIYLQKGKTQSIYAWDEVRSVISSLVKPNHAQFQLILISGEKIKFNFFYMHFLFQFMQCCLNAQREYSNFHFATIKYQLATGYTIEFASLRISNNSLRLGKKRIVWDDIASIKIINGQLHIYKKKKFFAWGAIHLSQVPNWWLLLDLINACISPDLLAKNSLSDLLRRP